MNFKTKRPSRSTTKPLQSFCTSLVIVGCGVMTGCSIAPTPFLQNLDLSRLRGPRTGLESMQIPPSNFPMSDQQRRRMHPRTLNGVHVVTSMHSRAGQVL